MNSSVKIMTKVRACHLLFGFVSNFVFIASVTMRLKTFVLSDVYISKWTLHTKRNIKLHF